MKKFFSLSAIVAVLAMLMTSVSVSSCSSDDDDDSTSAPTFESYTYTVDSVTVNTGSLVAYKHGSTYGTFSVTKASAEEVDLVFFSDLAGTKQVGTVTLSDAGTSYVNTDFKGITKAAATDAAASVLMAKRYGYANVISGTKATATKSGATATYFAKIK